VQLREEQGHSCPSHVFPKMPGAPGLASETWDLSLWRIA
jgi:hypothetical protein